MNNNKLLSTCKDTFVSKAIEQGVEMAFQGTDDTMENAAQAVEDAVEHVADHVVDHAAAGFIGTAAEHTFHHFVAAPIAPARIAGEAVKDLILSNKSPAEIGKSVEKNSFNALFIGGMITLAAGGALTSGGLLAIPLGIGVSYVVAKDVSRKYGGIAKGVAWGYRGVGKMFKRTSPPAATAPEQPSAS